MILIVIADGAALLVDHSIQKTETDVDNYLDEFARAHWDWMGLDKGSLPPEDEIQDAFYGPGRSGVNYDLYFEYEHIYGDDDIQESELQTA